MPRIESSCITFVLYIILGVGWFVVAVVALTYLLVQTDVHGLFVLAIVSVMFVCGATYWYIYRQREEEEEEEAQAQDNPTEEQPESHPQLAIEVDQPRPDDAPPPYENVILLPPSYEQLYENHLITPNDLKAAPVDVLSCPKPAPES